MIFCERAGNFRERGGNLIRLGREDQNSRGLGGVKIGRKSFRARFAGKMFPRRVKRIGGGADEDEFLFMAWALNFYVRDSGA